MIRSRLVLASLAALLAGCREFATSPSLQASASEVTILKPPPNTVDSAFLSLNREIPGFGGFFFDDHGNLNVMLKDSNSTDVARRRLAPVVGLYRGQGGMRGAGQVIVRPARFDFGELWNWKRMSEPLLRRGLAFSVDADEVRNAVVFETERAANIGAIREWATASGIPANAIVVEVKRSPAQLTELTDRVRPFMAGIQEGGSGACTMGPMLRYVSTSGPYADTVKAFLINSHCTSTVFDGIGTVIYQPTYSGSSRVGVEIADPRIATITADSSYCWAASYGRCRLSDAAVIQVDDSIASHWELGKIAVTNNLSPDSTSLTINSSATKTITEVYNVLTDYSGQTV